MTIQEQLIKTIKAYPKFNGVYDRELPAHDFVNLDQYPPNTILINDTFPLINEAYPSKFNLSVSEYLWSEMCKKRNLVLKKGIFDYTSLPEHSFWVITRNIRDEDFDKIVQGSNQHRLLFHIAGVSGFSVTTLSLETRKFYLSKCIEFLAQYIRLSRLKISYFPGGKIEKHGINKDFPEDINISIYMELREKNNFSIFPTLEQTFLSLKVFGSPIYWGYRNEFLVQHKDSLIDIGTIECLPYTPTFVLENGETQYLDVLENKKGFIGSGIGLERLMMIGEDVDNIWDISSIRPLIDLLRSESEKESSNNSLFLASEIISVLQYIISETGDLTTRILDNKHRRGIASKYVMALIGLTARLNLKITDGLLEKFFELNIELNPIDSQSLTKSQNVISTLFDIISEGVRMYEASEKYRNKTNSLIKDIL